MELQLKERTTYRTNKGALVHIAGSLGPRQGYAGFWSIEGDHYSADGCRYALRRIATPVGVPQKWERYTLDADAGDSIASEATEPEHVDWWKGVVTRRGGASSPVSSETITEKPV